MLRPRELPACTWAPTLTPLDVRRSSEILWVIIMNNPKRAGGGSACAEVTVVPVAKHVRHLIPRQAVRTKAWVMLANRHGRPEVQSGRSKSSGRIEGFTILQGSGPVQLAGFWMDMAARPSGHVGYTSCLTGPARALFILVV
jgi:hypothetical protein